jgi:hypothetical protein
MQLQVKAYQKATSVNSRLVDAHFNLGVLHHTFEKVELAIPSYERAIRLDSSHHDALSNLGSARHKVCSGHIHASVLRNMHVYTPCMVSSLCMWVYMQVYVCVAHSFAFMPPIIHSTSQLKKFVNHIMLI